MIQLSNSVVQAILSAAPAIQTGNIFALPVVATQFTWQTSFTGTPTAIAIQILTSLDGTNFVLADSSTSTAGEGKTVLSSAAFIQARINTVTPGPCTLVTISVIAEEGHEPVDVGGGGPALPTAPVGQVLISQGAGVDPIFSAGPSVSSINGEFGVTSGQGAFKGNSVIIQSAFTLAQLTPGTFIGTLADISDSTVTTWGATVVGGGSNRVLARWNGTVWKVIGV